jgi:hypothetical protein
MGNLMKIDVELQFFGLEYVLQNPKPKKNFWEN